MPETVLPPADAKSRADSTLINAYLGADTNIEFYPDKMIIRPTLTGLSRCRSLPAIGKADDEALVILLEEHFNNTRTLFSIVNPEAIGALTDSLIFRYGDPYGSDIHDHHVYWYPKYETELYLDVLRETGEIVFAAAEDR